MREELAILQDRFAALSGSIGPVLNRLGDDNCENLSQAVGQSFGMASVTRPGSIGLYDAQARR